MESLDYQLMRLYRRRTEECGVEWLNYHHLFYFWRIAREGGLSRAAESLRVSHSTLSAQLRSLEVALGGALFERTGRQLALTPLGEKVASYADDIFRLGTELVEAAKGQVTERRIVLRAGIVGSLPKTVAYRLLRPALDMNGAHTLFTRQDDLATLVSELAGGRLHLVLSDAPPPDVDTTKVFAHSLGSSGILFYASQKIASAHRSGFPGSLEGAPLLLPSSSSAVRRQIDRWFVDNDVRPRIVGEFDDAGLMRAMGVHGHGIFPVRAALRAEVEEGGNVAKVGEIGGVSEQYYVLSTERRIRHPAVSAIIERARAHLG